VRFCYALLLALSVSACGQKGWDYGDVRKKLLRGELHTHHDLARKLNASLKEGVITSDSHLRIDSFVIEGEPRKVIFAHPPLRMIFPVRVRKGQRLVTGAAMHPGSWDKEGDGVRFLVKARTAGSEEELLGSVYVDPKHRGQDRRWRDLSFDLSGYEGDIVGLVLETTYGSAGDGSYDWAGWVEPLVVSTDPPAQPPSIVLITIGGLRADHLGCYGATQVSTPGIDILASGGFVFQQAYATSDDQIRALTGLLASRLSADLGAELLPGVGPETLAEAAGGSGYRPAAFIASHTVAGHLGTLARGFQIIESPDGDSWGANELTGKAIQWMASKVEKKFLIWTHYADLEFDVPKGSSTEQVRSSYAGLVSTVDAELQRLLLALTAAALDNSTIVVLCSDRGRFLGEHGMVGDTHGLYPQVTRIPLVIRYPEMWRGGRHLSSLVQATDVPATLADITELSLHVVDGKSLVGLVSDLASMARDEVRAVSQGERMALNGRWLYVERRGRRGPLLPGQELYDLLADPELANNIAGDHPEAVLEMAAPVEDLPW
jgi:arylsulfatase A-like enzyme